MNGKIKVALCLSGEPRSSMFCFPYIYENLINLSPECEVDVYSYSFKSFRALPLYNCKKFVIDTRNSGELSENWLKPIDKKLSPESLKLLINTTNNSMHNQSSVKNLFLMYSNIQNCYNLIDKKYDIYIRSRYDLVFESPFPNQIKDLFSRILNNKIDLILPKSTTFEKNPLKEICDYFAIGNHKGISYYSNLINYLLSIINKIHSFRSEDILAYYLNANQKLRLEKVLLRTPLIRGSLIHSTPPYLHLDP